MDVLSDSQHEEAERAIAELADRRLSVAEVRDVKKAFGEDESGQRLASAVLSSAGLQSKAQAKLGEGIWWVTEKSLQQATPWQVAAWKATCFANNPVQDFCCGIGGDAIALSQRGPLTAVDSDRAIGMMAAANLNNHGGTNAKVTIANVETQAIVSDSFLHIDPDRRSGQNQHGDSARTTSPDFYSPAWDTVVAQLSQAAAGWVKLAPTATIDPIDELKSHRVWISLIGTVREQSFLTGDLVDAFAGQMQSSTDNHVHSAVMIDREGGAQSFSGHVEATVDEAAKPSGYIIDPNAAIRAAGLTYRFASDHDLQTLGGPSGYLTGDAENLIGAVAEPIVWTGSCDDRKLRRELRSRGMYPKRIKTRGVDQDPNKLEKKLRDCGDQPITLWIGRAGKKRYAAFTLTDV